MTTHAFFVHLHRIVRRAWAHIGGHWNFPGPSAKRGLVATLAWVALAANASAESGTDSPVLRIDLNGRELGQLRRDADRARQRLPAALPVVHVEGILPTSDAYKRANAAKADWVLISALASAYAAAPEGQETSALPYARAFEQYLTAWLDVYVISGNPIDETDLGHWLLAFRTAGSALTPATHLRLRQFACQLSMRYQLRPPSGKSSSTNNWQSHRVKLAVMGAHVCGDAAMIARATDLFDDQLRDNLRPTGEVIDFLERDAIHYVVYSLEPLVEASLFASLYGTTLYTRTGPKGQSIARSLQWLAPYVAGEKRHLEFVNSTVRFDAQRAAAGVAGFSGEFKPEKARHLYWLSARLDPSWAASSAVLGSAWISHRAAWLAHN